MKKKTNIKVSFDDLVTKEHLTLQLAVQLEQFREEFREEIREDMREQTATILQAVDKVLTRFDKAEKDNAAHTMLHKRITDDLHGHDLRIKKLEVAVN